ncbi:DUF3558 domain-containing protein [Streptomyces sp. NEAU-W12]|uniref:DUF3558 domain-containing protein n=1 Tax=Streptomyces sp. NEAU-W12 TaxID=2994668 RepID=UPI00224AFD76|nr:DUF3558 domain-containing protein [Streptomyces sp. NEAU-W12]MCX2927297.1 DUF3558 domain-containing protein [Streptomyces sp. NEAU-W12]
MQRRAYVPGVAALLAALLAGCTGSSGDGSQSDNSNPGSAGTATQAAQPGRYATLPEPCGAVGTETLDRLLPGIGEMTDETRRTKAYEGEPTLTYDTDRKVGCGWKVESVEATNRLVIDFERVVSYDNTVSDDSQAGELFATKQDAADLPEPTATESVSAGTDDADGADEEEGGSTSAAPDASESPSSDVSDASVTSDSPDSSGSSGSSGSGSPSPTGTSGTSGSASPSVPPADLQPRLLDGFGDEAFIDDELSSSGSTVKQRTVTVAFRTSNVIVTIEYAEQPATVGAVPDSKEMQDRARNLASLLADSLGG